MPQLLIGTVKGQFYISDASLWSEPEKYFALDQIIQSSLKEGFSLSSPEDQPLSPDQAHNRAFAATISGQPFSLIYRKEGAAFSLHFNDGPEWDIELQLTPLNPYLIRYDSENKEEIDLETYLDLFVQICGILVIRSLESFEFPLDQP